MKSDNKSRQLSGSFHSINPYRQFRIVLKATIQTLQAWITSVCQENYIIDYKRLIILKKEKRGTGETCYGGPQPKAGEYGDNVA